MTDSIHGHAVMQMMLDSGQIFTRESLHAAIAARFGSDARFHTCSDAGLDAAALIDLLAARGKFVEQGSGFNTSPSHMCAHEKH